MDFVSKNAMPFVGEVVLVEVGRTIGEALKAHKWDDVVAGRMSLLWSEADPANRPGMIDYILPSVTFTLITMMMGKSWWGPVAGAVYGYIHPYKFQG